MSDRSANTHDDDEATLLVVDGHSLAFRAFYALPVENFTTSTGQPTNAVWGFATMLAQVVQTERPKYLAVGFDVKGGTFRNTMLPEYKATRALAPEDLLTQLPLIQKLLDALGITYIEKPGYEGDDVIATLATMGANEGLRTLVLSGDRDAFQLINDHVTVLYPGHHFKDLKHMDAKAVIERYDVTPEQYPDLAALRGETSDNIPGVPGVGDKYAAKWINEYGSLNAVIDHADTIGGKKGQALREHADQVKLNRTVNAVVRDLDLGISMSQCTFHEVHTEELEDLLTSLQFGARTRSTILSAFAGATDSTRAEDASEESQERELPQPDVNQVHDGDGLLEWASAHLPKAAEKTPDNDDAPEPQDESAHHEDDGAMQPDGSSLSQEHVGTRIKQSWVLYATAHGRHAQRKHKKDVRLILLAGHSLIEVMPGDDGEMLEAIRTVLADHHDTMVVHGYKEHLHALDRLGIELAEPLFDTKLAGYLIQPDVQATSLEQAASTFLDLKVANEDELVQGELNLEQNADESHETLAADSEERIEERQAITHAAIVTELAPVLAKTLDSREQYHLLRTIEMPVSKVLYTMERTGATVDRAQLQHLLDQFGADAEQAQRIAWQSAGAQINLQSPKQLQKFRFEDMGLRPGRRTKSGSYTTNAAALQDLYIKSANNERANTFLGALLQHRETNKLKQIVQTLMETIEPTDGKIHTTFEQTVAATGRLSSVDPNLQNIPNRNAAGREIRSAFIPSDGFESLLSCDYSQVELRIMADFSGDESLIEAFRSGTDFHKYVASLVYKVPVDEITPDQRSHVKAMSYGLAYGLSTYGLAQQLKISPAAADVLKEQYFTTFGKVHQYLESQVQLARKNGYTETLFGRRRYFPALRSTNRTLRDAAERAALNAPIQGSAADIMKLAMIRAQQALVREHMNSRIILQIHDELVVEIAHGEAKQVTALVQDAMEHAVTLAVPLNVSTGIGPNWQAAAH